jgi:hypothetical protein
MTLRIIWALGPFVRPFTSLVDLGDIYPPQTAPPPPSTSAETCTTPLLLLAGTPASLQQQPRPQFAQPRGFPPRRALSVLDVLQQQSRRYATTLGEALCCPSCWIEPCSSSARAVAPSICAAPPRRQNSLVRPRCSVFLDFIK